MTGEEKFITAILTQAVEDTMYMGKRPRYLKHKVEAIDWILNKESEHHWSFLNYCTMLGLSPSKIQNKVKGFIDPKLTTIQKNIIRDTMKKGRQDDNRIQV
jgi:hypothetical protein|tara:strand:- start:32 stop:334 length:303 start_codon:yes stop_codon:yes gene_type:complete